jgi:hypothetical protein
MLLFVAMPSHADNGTVMETVDSYTKALKAGDVVALGHLTGGRFYAKRRALLEDNTEYPEWLRQYYSGSSFSYEQNKMATVNHENKSAVVADLVIRLQSGETAMTSLLMQQTIDGSGWEIVDQVR